MTATAEKQTLGFQAEVKQLLNLMIHSLYSNKEIFLRELISNASDAADRLRFEALAKPEFLKDDPELKIRIEINKEARTISIIDNGIGMNHDEVIAHLGTIAKSGTKEFLKTLSGDQAKDAQLIGQFGVGFYSSFIVADRVTVLTRRADATSDQGVMWESRGEGEYTIETANIAKRGTEVTLHLREEEDEFLDGWRLRTIVRKYSDHISIPIEMLKEEAPAAEGEEQEKTVPQFEVVNRATALWTLNKNEIKDTDHHEFYKHISHDFNEPLLWSHNRVEGKQQYISLLYIPAKAPYDLWDRDRPRGLKLYVQRVFIMDDAEQFLPMYLRFVKGVIDSSDLPLNVSREILQNSKVVDTLRSACTNRVLSMLEGLAKDDKEKYLTFWKEFGNVLKEGPAEDFANRERLAKLLRFSSTLTDKTEQEVALEDYVSRMKPEQNKIYYVTAETFAAAKSSPHLEIFRKKGIEVLLLSDRVDEWLVSNLNEFDGKSLQSVAKGALDLDSMEDEATKEEHKKTEDEFADFIKKVKDVLTDEVKEVRVTYRLTDSPACLVADDQGVSLQLQRMLKDAGQAFPDSKPIFEINPEHPMIKRLKTENVEHRFSEWTHILFDQAVLAEGGKLKEPATFVKRLNSMLMELAS